MMPVGVFLRPRLLDFRVLPCALRGPGLAIFDFGFLGPGRSSRGAHVAGAVAPEDVAHPLAGEAESCRRLDHAGAFSGMASDLSVARLALRRALQPGSDDLRAVSPERAPELR